MHHLRVTFCLPGQLYGETKVRDNEAKLLINKKVLGFYVAVSNTLIVQVVKALD